MALSAVMTIHASAFYERQENLHKQLAATASQLRIVLVADSFNKEAQLELQRNIERRGYDNVQIIFGEYGNPGDARNAGLAFIDSDWVCFWDSDDYADPYKFIDLVKKAEEAKADIAKGSYQIKTTIGNIQKIKNLSIVEPDKYYRHILDPGIWRYAFSRKIYKKITFPSLRIGEDQDFLVEALINTPKLFSSTEIVYTYFVGDPNQITRNVAAFQDVGKSLDYLSTLRSLRGQNRSANLIILTSYFKQLLSCLSRVGWSGSNLNCGKVVAVIFGGPRGRDNLIAIKSVIIWRLTN